FSCSTLQMNRNTKQIPRRVLTSIALVTNLAWAVAADGIHGTDGYLSIAAFAPGGGQNTSTNMSLPLNFSVAAAPGHCSSGGYVSPDVTSSASGSANAVIFSPVEGQVTAHGWLSGTSAQYSPNQY